MGNCFTLVYVLDKILVSDKNLIIETAHLNNQTDIFLDGLLNNLEIEAPDYLVEKILNGIKND